MSNSSIYRSKRLNFLKTVVINNFSLLGLIIVVFTFQLLTKGRLLSSNNLTNIFNNVFSIGLLSMGVVFLMSLGEMDLSVGAMIGMSAAFGAFASEISVWLILPVAIITGLAIGAINGLIISFLEVESFIGTLAVSFVVRGITTWLLNGSAGIPISMRVFDKTYIKLSLFMIVLVILFVVFEKTAYGKRCRAIGSSREAARQSGTPIKSTRFLAFVISGFICGLVAFFSLVRTATASSSTGNGFEFDVLIAVLFGGMTLTGGWPVKFRSTIIGSLSIAILLNGMSAMGITGLYQQIIQGLILVTVVVITFDRRNVATIK